MPLECRRAAGPGALLLALSLNVGGAAAGPLADLETAGQNAGAQQAVGAANAAPPAGRAAPAAPAEDDSPQFLPIEGDAILDQYKGIKDFIQAARSWLESEYPQLDSEPNIPFILTPKPGSNHVVSGASLSRQEAARRRQNEALDVIARCSHDMYTIKKNRARSQEPVDAELEKLFSDAQEQLATLISLYEDFIKAEKGRSFAAAISYQDALKEDRALLNEALKVFQGYKESYLAPQAKEVGIDDLDNLPTPKGFSLGDYAKDLRNKKKPAPTPKP